MQEKDLFEYAVLRLMPRVERGEFLNIGVVMYCKRQSFLRVQYLLDIARLQAAFPSVDLDEISLHLRSFEQICEGKSAAGTIARLDPASRFRWLTARRSTIIQTSEVHPGLCVDASETFEQLFTQLVL
ncbi:DUF3037 domain-containing protein [Arundinibacter roseus]|uniref:DUF3037 domain-containing protein n=1 Tax=Arundinibacter roseus TaxID=2070510 RepID=A0A4R4K7X7_9BACT|nr:DUF3037 domain-containing protein [Arundinibacter roseus]TDB62279.1 DUF3037 domain-containing protein [Arundinibacter roseus]